MAGLNLAALRATEDDRAQIILVTAFALAVAFIALALILNSAIFAQNLASRSGPATSDAVTYRSQMKSGVGDLMRYANAHNNSSIPIVDYREETGINNLSSALASQEAQSGRVVGIENVNEIYGTRLVQNNSTRTFRNACPSSDYCLEDWSLVHNTSSLSSDYETAAATRKYEMNVSRSGLATSCDAFDDCFHVNVSQVSSDAPTPEAGSENWSMAVYRDGGGAGDPVAIEVYNGSEVSKTTVSSSEDFVQINLTAGTVEGREWEPLDFAENVGPGYGIFYRNGNSTEGTYSLIVKDFTFFVLGPPSPRDVNEGYTTPQPDSPFWYNAVYETEFTLLYQTDSLTYESELRVAPGEPDD